MTTSRRIVKAALLALLSTSSVQLGCQDPVERFDDLVTRLDTGFDDFSGNMGRIESEPSAPAGLPFTCDPDGACRFRLAWDFRSAAPEAFTGVFLSVFGITDTLVLLAGRAEPERIFFGEHSLDLDNIDGDFKDPGGPWKYDRICVEIVYRGADPVTLRLELKDSAKRARFTRTRVTGSTEAQPFCWSFRTDFQRAPDADDLDLHRAKQFVLLVERRSSVDGVMNPEQGELELRSVALEPGRPASAPEADDVLLDLVERRAYQYFIDWASRKGASREIPQDRSTFADLLTVGGVGFALPAHVVAAERGWISRASAAQRVRDALRALDLEDGFGREPSGRIGYKGFFYHFLGPDGKRKLNFDFPETPADESAKTVEVSTIDTALAVIGMLVAERYFQDPSDLVEAEIRERVRSIAGRVDWPFMLEPCTQQLYLAWKPEYVAGSFERPAPGGGFYSGTTLQPATLDFYTDEALIALLLGVGSETHPLSPQTLCSLDRSADEGGLVTSFFGPLFTYQFLHAFIDTRTLSLHACDDEPGPIDWYQNSRLATWRAIAASVPTAERPTYGSDAWGRTAAEGPDDAYRAVGPQSIRRQKQLVEADEEDGTVGYYAMVSAVSFGDDLRAQAIAAIRAGFGRGHFSSRFGLPDAFHTDLATHPALSGSAPGKAELVRNVGSWVGRALFAIDQGPMVLHLENARTGLVWRLAAASPDLNRARERMLTPAPQPSVDVEVERQEETLPTSARSNASQQTTVVLRAGMSTQVEVCVPRSREYALGVRYSNDNFGPLESVEILVDGRSLGSFDALDTGDFGEGWNNFVQSGFRDAGVLTQGRHRVVLSARGGDGFGVELDKLTVLPAPRP